MADLTLSGTKPQRIHLVHMVRGLDPETPVERWYLYADYGFTQTIVAMCDEPGHARAVASALAVVYGIREVDGDLPAPADLAAVPARI